MRNKIMILLLASVFAAALVHANLLNNPGFEEPGEVEDSALYWRMDNPNDHGGSWGNAIRVDWRANEGKHVGVVRGTWAGLGDYGGFWQEAQIEPGGTYKASAWFWADGSWRAETQELKVEFWNAERTEMVDVKSVALDDIGEIWVQKEVSAKAPENAAWARVVINVAGAGESGALQMDQVVLEAAP